MKRTAPIAASLLLLGWVWLGPPGDLAAGSFAAHMLVHMTVVAVAAPLVAWGLGGSRIDPVAALPGLFAPVPASLIEFLVVSAWHAPVLHHAARADARVFAVEQASFLAAGLLLWLSAMGGSRRAQPWRAGAGAGALLFTSMHMTLLGALFAVAPRPLYTHGDGSALALWDQHLGGGIMLLLGGASYLAGGLWLTARTLQPARQEEGR